MFRKLPIAVFVLGVLVQLTPYVAGCYDPKSPNLPPCSGQPYPDPCDGKSAAKDAGRDG